MSRIKEVKEIYQKITDIITSNKQEWKDYLKFASRTYKYNFDNAVLIYAQRPDATMVAKMEIWNRKIGRYVNKGTRSIAVFDTSKPSLKLDYLFDIKDTNGENHTIPRLWKLNDDIAPRLLEKLNEKYSLDHEELEYLIGDIVEERVAINYDSFLAELKYDLNNTWLENLPIEGVERQCHQIVEDSVKYVVASRYGFDLSLFEDDMRFETINHFNTLPLTFRIGNAVSNISEEILREIENEVGQIIKEIRSEQKHERAIRTELQRSRGQDVSRDSNIQSGGNGQEAPGQVWADGDELSKGESSEPLQRTIGNGGTSGDYAQGQRGSISEVRSDHGAVGEDKSPIQSAGHHAELQGEKSDENDSGGNSTSRNSIPDKIKNIEQIDIFESQQSGSFLMPQNEETENADKNSKWEEYKNKTVDNYQNSISGWLNNNEVNKSVEAQDKAEIKEKSQKINYRYSPDDEIGVGGLKTKFRNNVEAIKTLKVIEEENRLATSDEQKILAKYVGWGGMPQAFDINAGGWSNEYAELKALLTPEEYASARASTPNAHYTSPIVIEGIYKALDNFGFTKGNILEPAMGIGNFFSMLPESIKDSKLYGIELDDISGRISKQLYQKAEIRIQGFEESNYPDNFFDVAIGNVPFGDYKLHDPKYDKHNFLIHDYFFAKALDKVRPGGILAFITSKGTLDKENICLKEPI